MIPFLRINVRKMCLLIAQLEHHQLYVGTFLLTKAMASLKEINDAIDFGILPIKNGIHR